MGMYRSKSSAKLFLGVFLISQIICGEAGGIQENGCRDINGKIRAKSPPDICKSAEPPGITCASSGDTSPFKLDAGPAGEDNLQSVHLQTVDGSMLESPLEGLYVAAFSASNSSQRVGAFKYDEMLSKMKMWCCDLNDVKSALSVVGKMSDLADVVLKWKPGDFQGEVLFKGTVVAAGNKCYKNLETTSQV